MCFIDVFEYDFAWKISWFNKKHSKTHTLVDSSWAFGETETIYSLCVVLSLLSRKHTTKQSKHPAGNHKREAKR